MDENFNSVMYKLVGMEMDYLDSVPYEMWDEMVAETTDEIMNRCRNVLPFGLIIGSRKNAHVFSDTFEIGRFIKAPNVFVGYATCSCKMEELINTIN